MNANTIKRIGYYILGAAIGGTIGKIIADQVFKEREPKQLEFDWEKEEEAEGEEEVKEEIIEKGPEVMTVPPSEIKEKKTNKSKRPAVDYSSISSKHLKIKPNLADVIKERLGEEAVHKESEIVSGTPYIISLDQYGAGDNHREKITLIYYEEDDTLSNQNEEIIINDVELLGPDGLLNFGQGSGDPDTVYIRNDNIGVDYEVVRLYKKYKETVAGMRDEKKKPARSTRSRNTRKVTKIDNGDDEDEEE